jgi:hypothetical protein
MFFNESFFRKPSKEYATLANLIPSLSRSASERLRSQPEKSVSDA